jgi:hypothetical protein
VEAPFRVSHWETPHGQSWGDSLCYVPCSDVVRLFETMIVSIEEGTRKNYATALLRFTQFCDAHNIPEEQRMPASEELISLFVTSWAGHIQHTTITSWLSGLCFWHVVNGAP